MKCKQCKRNVPRVGDSVKSVLCSLCLQERLNNGFEQQITNRRRQATSKRNT